VENKRIKLVKDLLKEDEILILQPGSNMFYLIRFTEEVMERPILLVISKEEDYIIAPKMYEEQLGYYHNNIQTYLDGENPYEKLKLKENSVLYIDDQMSFRFLSNIIKKTRLKEIRQASDIMSKLRVIKDDQEIEIMKEGVRYAERIFNEFLNRIRENLTERELSFTLKRIMLDNGFEPSFDPIITSGSNTSMPHLRYTDRKVRVGDVIIIDYGIKYKGYSTDLTKVISIGESNVKDIFEIVKEAKEIVEREIIEGIKGSDADKIARTFINSKGFGRFFIHRTGHGIGLDVHEEPYLAPDYDGKLLNGMIFTIEPGIYIPNKFGIRLEDMVLLSNEKTYVLNKKQEEIIII
jgi:Xaa-Pro aminopeptidase